MIVPFVLIGVFLILWSVYDIFKQSIDWKYKIVTALWRMIPRYLWERLTIRNK